MLTRHKKFLSIGFFTADLILLNSILWITAYFMQQLWWQRDGSHFSTLCFQFNICWVFISYWLDFYETPLDFVAISRTTIRVALWYVMITLLVLFSLKEHYTSRLFFGIFIAIFTFSLYAIRYITFYFRKRIPVFNEYDRVAVILGTGDMMARTHQMLTANDSGILVKGYFADQPDPAAPVSYLGKKTEALQYAREHFVTDIFSLVMPTQNPIIPEISMNAEKDVIRMHFIPNLDSAFKRKVVLNTINDVPIISLRHEPLDQMGNRIKKRLFDIAFTLFIFAILLWWLIPIIALMIIITSGFPIFFIQQRSGRDGRIFNCMKFRTMRVNKDADRIHAQKNDARITPIGNFLRRSNLDEIPQFINVLKGDMSIVGPRPHMVKHTEEYRKIIDGYMIRHHAKPGITGLAQISGLRGDLDPEKMAKRVEKDIQYMQSWTIWQDIKIVIKTIDLTIVGDENAY